MKALRWMLLGYFFFVYNVGGEPAWKLGEFISSAECEKSREWVIAAQAAKPAIPNVPTIPPGPCFVQYILQQ